MTEEEKEVSEQAEVIEPGLTEAQREYVLADRYFCEVVKPGLDRLRMAQQGLIDEVGVGNTFQDSEGIVYQTAHKKGKWVDFYPYDVLRTRRKDEAKGSLSMKQAEEAGYDVSVSKHSKD